MKTIVVLIALISSCSLSQAQNASPEDTVSNPDDITTLSYYHDTLFPRRKVVRGEEWTDYNCVYIEQNRDSKYYNWLTSFAFDEFDSMLLESYDIELVPSADRFPSNKTSGLPKTWIPVYSFNDEFYTYKPSDFGNAGSRILTDSLFIKWYMDGLMPMQITSQGPIQGTDQYVFELEMEGAYQELLIIQPYDKERQIYLFQYKSRNNAEYQLYIPSDNAKDFDMVVNTGNHKAREYRFDEFDIESYLGIPKK